MIRPALAGGKTVVSDRFLLANIVYQGHVGGLGADTVRAVGRVATGDFAPDCTFLLDMSPQAALRRMGEHLDRVESRGEEYRQALRAGFLEEARRPDSVIHIVDADRPVDDVQAELRDIAQRLLDVQ